MSFIGTCLECLQGWGHHYFPGQPAPILDHSVKKFSPLSSVVHFESISLCPITCRIEINGFGHHPRFCPPLSSNWKDLTELGRLLGLIRSMKSKDEMGIRSVTAFQVQKDGKNGCDESDRALHNRRWQKVVNEGGYTDFSQWRSPSRCEASKGFPLSLQSWIADLPAADDPGKEKANRLHSAGQKVPQLWVSSSWITTPPACSVLASFVAVFPKDLLRGRCLVWQSCHLAWYNGFCAFVTLISVLKCVTLFQEQILFKLLEYSKRGK